jgi:hypothetical protein
MAVIEKQAAKQFVVQMAHVGLEERFSVGRATDRLATRQGFGKVAPRKFGQCAYCMQSAATNPMAIKDIPRVRVQQGSQAAKPLHEQGGDIAIEHGSQ